MKWETLADYAALSTRAASLMLDAISRDGKLVLGLPTGNTPVGMYDRVVAECGRQYHCFRDIVAFNLDEYVGIPRDHPGSYFTFMQRHLFAHFLFSQLFGRRRPVTLWRSRWCAETR